MRTTTLLPLVLAAASGCYHPDYASGFESVGAPPGASDTSSDASSGGPDDTSGASDEPASTSGPGDPGSSSGSSSGSPFEPEEAELDPCSLCGCVGWIGRAPSPSTGDDLRVALAPADDGGALLAAAGSGQVDLVRLDGAGQPLWTRGMEGEVLDLHAVALAEGRFVLAGTVVGALALTPGDPEAVLQGAGGQDGFVVALDGTGAPTWHLTVGDPAEQRVTGLATTGPCEGDDPGACRVHLAGVAAGSLGLFDAPPGDDAVDLFVAGLPAAGPDAGAVWSLRIASGGELRPPSLAAGGADDLVLAATVRDEADPGDILVVRTSGDGSERWTRRLAAPGEQWSGAVAVGPDGSLRLSGRTRGPIDLGTGPIGQANVETPFVAALDVEGAPAWARPLAVWPPAQGGLAVLPDGATWLTGAALGAADLGGGTLEHGGARDVFIARWADSGAHRCSGLHGDPRSQSGLLTARGAGGRTFVVARVQGTVELASGMSRTSETEEDLMVAAFDP